MRHVSSLALLLELFILFCLVTYCGVGTLVVLPAHRKAFKIKLGAASLIEEVLNVLQCSSL